MAEVTITTKALSEEERSWTLKDSLIERGFDANILEKVKAFRKEVRRPRRLGLP
jgi:hypothetical protein